MKQVLIIISALVWLTSCKKDEPVQPVYKVGEAVTVIPEQSEQPEQESPEVSEEVTGTQEPAILFSVKNTSTEFGCFVDYTADSGAKTIHLEPGAMQIIKAVPGTIQASKDVIITLITL